MPDISSITVPINGVPTTLNFKGSGGGGNANIQQLTRDEYAALTDAQKKNGTMYLVSNNPFIKVSAMPTKTVYSGDDYGNGLDLTGVAVKYVEPDGTETNVTSTCTFSPADGASLTPPERTATQTVTVTYTVSNKTYTTTFEVTLEPLPDVSTQYIDVATEPTKTEYNVGETLDLTGISVLLMDGAGNGTDVTASCTFSPPEGTVINETTDVTVTYEYDDLTLTTEFTVTV